MSDVVSDLFAANPGAVHPAPAVPPGIDEGGVQVFDPATGPPREEGTQTPAADMAVLVKALTDAIKPKPEAEVIGERVPIQDRDGRVVEGSVPAREDAGAGEPAQALSDATPAPVAPPELSALAQQLAEAHQRLARAEADTAWRQQNEQTLEAVRAKWPYILGLEEKVATTTAAQLQEKSQRELAEKLYGEMVEAANKHVSDSISAGVQPNLPAFTAQWRANREREIKQERLLERAATLEQDLDARLGKRMEDILTGRDKVYQQQVATQQAEMQKQAAWNYFQEHYAKLEAAVPAIKGDEGMKELVWYGWTKDTRQQVPAVAEKYLKSLRVQTAAAQAPQKTRAEVQAAMPRTVSGGSGAATTPQAQRPPGWDKKGLKDRIFFNQYGRFPN